MSTPNPAAADGKEKEKEKDKDSSVGSKFTSFFHGLKSDKKESSSEKDKEKSAKDQSAKDAAAAAAAVAAATSQTKEQKVESNKPSTKEKFFDFFKSDADKKAEKGKEKDKEKDKEKEKEASPAAPQRVQTAAPDPIKLELRCVPAMPLAPLNPSVGDAIEAEGFILRSSSGTVPFSFSTGNCRWFRASADGFDQIAQSKLPSYVATIDDVDCKICCQWMQDDDNNNTKSTPSPQQSSVASQSSFGEIGPIHMNPAIAQASLDVFKGGKALFTVKESGTDELMTITVKKTMIRILPARGGEVRYSFMLLPKSGSATSIHSSTSTPSSVKFLLDSIDPTRFSIEDVQTHKVFRGSVGLEGDQTLATASVQELNRVRRERDVMACLIRRIIKTGSELLPAEDKPLIAATLPTDDVPAIDLLSFLSNTSTADSITTATNVASLTTSSTSDADIVNVKIAPAAFSSESTDLIDLKVVPVSSAPVSADKSSSAIAPPSITPVSLQLSPIAAPSTATTSAPPPSAGSGTPTSQLFPAHSPSQILSLSQRISELTAEKNLFKENINLILVEKQQAEAQAKLEIEALKRQLGQKDTELNEFKTKLVKSGEDVDAMKLAINTLSEQMTHQANQEIKLSNEIRALKNEKENAAAELKKEREAHTKALQGKDEAMSKLQLEFSTKSKELMSLNSDYQTALATSQKAASLEDKMSKMQENESNLKHDIGIYKSELVKMKEIQQKLDVVEMENYQLRKEKEKRKAEQTQQLNTSTHTDGASTSEPSTVPAVVVPPDSTTSMTSDDALELALPSASVRRGGGAGAGSNSGSSTPTKPGETLTPTTATHASNPSLSSTSSTADAAAIALLTQQVADLQSQCETLTQARDEAEQELESVQRELSTLQTSTKAQVDALAQLQSEHEDLKKSHEEVVANRNYFKRKCESLSSSVDKMIKEAHLQPSVSPMPSASPIPPAATQSTSSLPASSAPAAASSVTAGDAETHKERKELKLRILELRNENAELNQTLAAYKKTLENNYALLKHERDANLLLSKSAAGGSSSSGGLLSFGRSKGNSQLLQQFESVRDLANSLSETIAEKDQNLTHLRRTNLLLAKRVFDLEKRFEVELTEDARNGKTFNGKIDLEQEELKYQQQLQNQSSTDNSRRNSIGSTSESNPNSVPSSPSARNSASPNK